MFDLNFYLRKFRADRRGSVAAIFSLSMLPLMAFIGASLDYGRAIASANELQSMIDASALRRWARLPQTVQRAPVGN